MKKREFLIFAAAVFLATVYFMGWGALKIPYLMVLTFGRMLGAYAVSLVFSISLGLLIAHNKRAYRMFFPVLDILQSVPILAYLPFAILLLINTIPVVGGEISAIFLIVTSMTWAVIFNVIEGARSIPSDIKDVARMNGVRGPNYLFHVLLPAIYAPVVSGSITGWGGGWYFLVAGEYISFGQNNPYILQGIGSFIAQSAYAGDFVHSLLGMAILAVMVLFMNVFVWGPLLARAARVGGATNAELASGQENWVSRSINGLYVKAKTYALSVLGSKTTAFMEFLRITPASQFDAPKGLTKYDAAIAVLVIVTFCATMALYGRPISEAATIFLFAGNTVMRIAIAYAIAVVWTTAFAIFFARNKEVIKTLMPVFDVLQSIPAIAVFPIIVVFVINIIGGQFGLEIACLLLLLTGTQWYLLFNLIRAVQNIPGEIVELSDILRMKNVDRIRHVMLPAIYPALIIGSMQAIGGAWNASIVSEYLTYNGQVYHVNGLAYLLDLAATNGDLPGLVLTVMMMIAIIIFLNKVVWRNALKHSDRYTF